jgi:rare lipoprotein A
MMGRGPILGRIVRVGVLLLAAGTLAACASADRTSKYSKRIVEDGEPVPKGGGTYKVGQPYRLNGRIYYPSEDGRYRAEGIASWYGPDFHGRETANGEVFDMHGISAAHPTLPLPSYARVTNLDNGRSIIVRLNDRGPYAKNRIIDVSIGAAKALDFYGKGLAHVRVEYVGRAPLEGSDDKMLMATLRQGTPAPAPSPVMIASSNPFVPLLADGSDTAASARGEGAPIPAPRPFSLGSNNLGSNSVGANSGRSPARSSGDDSATERGPRSVVRLPSGPEPIPVMAGAPASAPVQGLGLMSGRGLY